ncbi:MAG: FtsQ-type POTRA domain-containing protein [Allobaculum sp.]|nr:FtsQ-type POTRA domain-containing protein [Allobaculum sp.]
MPKKKAKTTSTPSNSESQKPKRIWPTWVKALIGFGTILVLSVGIYLLSPATQIQALSCTGNYYYTPQQVYAIAGVSIDDRTFLHTPSQVASALKQNPLIESATVELDGQNMSIEITEKTIIGYFEQDGFQYLVSSEGERIRMTDELDASTLVHFPLIAKMEDGSMADIDLIAKEVRRHPDYLTRDVLEKIAEIQPWEESYDKEMLKLVLQDGNTVFTSIRSLYMMSAYQQVLANLQGDNVCFLLDGENGVVNKVACTYMYLTPEQRAENREIPKSVLFKNTEEEDENEDEENKDENASSEANTTPPAQTPAEQTSDQTTSLAPETPLEESDPASTQIPADLSQITDWGPSAVETILHSASTGLFYDTEHQIYYTYDAGTDTFFPYTP